MKVELNDDAARAAEKAAGQLGMSVAGYVNWLAKISTGWKDEDRPEKSRPPKFPRRKPGWVVKF